jgi:hypothetical protein
MPENHPSPQQPREARWQRLLASLTLSMQIAREQLYPLLDVPLRLLCQLGTLGILTFATVIGMMVRGELGWRETMILRHFTSSLQLGEVAATLRLVVGMTLLIEAFGALLLYWTRPEGAEGSRLWLAVFHAISAFCNAGFSIFSDRLANRPHCHGIYAVGSQTHHGPG